MDKRKRWWLSMAAVVVFVLAADYFFLHFLFPLKRAAIMQEMNRGVEESLEKNPAELPKEDGPATEPPAPSGSRTSLLGVSVASAAVASLDRAPASTSGPDNFASVLADCLGPRAHSSDTNTEMLLARMEKSGVLSREVPIENWHVRRKDGTEERIMLVVSDRENANGKKEVRLFGVDAEGLPIPRDLDGALAYDPKPAYIEKLRGVGEQIFHQKKEILQFKDGTSANIEWNDGHIRDAQFFLEAKTLSCRELDCRCH